MTRALEFRFIARHPNGAYVMGMGMLGSRDVTGTYERDMALRMTEAGFASLARLMPVEREEWRAPAKLPSERLTGRWMQ